VNNIIIFLSQESQAKTRNDGINQNQYQSLNDLKSKPNITSLKEM